MKVFATLTAALALVSAPSAHAQVTINTSSWIASSHPLVAGITVPLCNDISSVTQGRVKCNMLPKAVVSAPQTFDAIRDGVADLSFIVEGYTPGRFMLTKAAEFPFLGNTAEANSVAYQRTYDQYFAKADEHKGVKVLAVFTHGPGQLFTANRAVTSVEELRGLKLRTGGGLINDLFKALGATGMFKPAPEVYELMSGGIVDGFVFPMETAESLKLIPLFKHSTQFPGGLYNVSFSMIMNPAKWAQISKPDQTAMQRLFGEPLARRAGKAWDEADARGLAAMKKAGIQFHPAGANFVAEVRQRAEPLEAQWVNAVKAKGVDGAAALKTMREQISRETGKTQ